jgi:hypothetical protein
VVFFCTDKNDQTGSVWPRFQDGSLRMVLDLQLLVGVYEFMRIVCLGVWLLWLLHFNGA